MFNWLDQYLLRRPAPSDDWTTTSRRIEGSSSLAPVIYFLPWHTSFKVAQRIGLVGRRFTACYELAPALVSSEPELPVAALKHLVEDVEQVLTHCGRDGRKLQLVGYSLGTYPAVYIANRLGAKVHAVASADRGDLMLWESPAAAPVRKRAIAKGYRLDDYSMAMKGYNPIDNMKNLGEGSLFISGRSDPFIPEARSRPFIEAAKKLKQARIVEFSGGHMHAIMRGARYVHHSLSQASGF